MRTATIKTAGGKFGQEVRLGPHTLVADEPKEKGGDDRGPGPHDFLLAALGSCTSMTLKVYADHKGIPLRSVEVFLEQEAKDGVHSFRRRIQLSGDLSVEQRARLLEIANKCPVHKTLTGTIRIESALVPEV